MGMSLRLRARMTTNASTSRPTSAHKVRRPCWTRLAAMSPNINARPTSQSPMALTTHLEMTLTMLTENLPVTSPMDMGKKTWSQNAPLSRKLSATRLHELYPPLNARMIMKRSAKSFLRMCPSLLRNKPATMNRRRFANLRSASNQSRLKSSVTRRSARRSLARSAPVLMLNNWFPPVPQLPSRTAVMSLRKSVKMFPRTSATRCPRRSRSSVATMSMKLNMGRVSQPTQLNLLTQSNLITQLNPLTQMDQATNQHQCTNVYLAVYAIKPNPTYASIPSSIISHKL